MTDVFAGGDVARGGSTVIQAMRDGRAAAEAIDRALRGRPVSAVGAHPAEPGDAIPYHLASRTVRRTSSRSKSKPRRLRGTGAPGNL